MIFLEVLVDVNNRDIAGTQIPDADCWMNMVIASSKPKQMTRQRREQDWYEINCFRQ